MTKPVEEQLFAYLANRYRDARTEVDELRQRALELVIAGCVADTAASAVGEIPPPRPGAIAEDSVTASEAGKPPPPRPGPDPAPRGADPVTEEGVAGEHVREPERVNPATPPEPRVVPDPAISLEPPPGPNRGFWGPPD